MTKLGAKEGHFVRGEILTVVEIPGSDAQGGFDFGLRRYLYPPRMKYCSSLVSVNDFNKTKLFFPKNRTYFLLNFFLSHLPTLLFIISIV